MCDITYIQGLVKRIYGKHVEADQIVPMQVTRSYTDGPPPRPFVLSYPSTTIRPDVVYFGTSYCNPMDSQPPVNGWPYAKLFGEDNGSSVDRALDIADVRPSDPTTGFIGTYGPMLFEACVLEPSLPTLASFIFVGYEIRTTT